MKIEQIIAVACGWAHSFCLSKDGLVYGFGKVLYFLFEFFCLFFSFLSFIYIYFIISSPFLPYFQGNDGQLGISSPPQDVFVPAPINMVFFPFSFFPFFFFFLSPSSYYSFPPFTKNKRNILVEKK